MVEIIPAIIPESLEEIRERISLVKNIVKKFQIDFIDGLFAPTKTWPFNLPAHPGTEESMKLPFSDEVVIEADMMIKYPEDWISDFLSIGARSFVLHIGSTHYLEKCIFQIKSQGLKVGLGIKPSANLEKVEEILRGHGPEIEVDFVQFMGSDRIGYNGVELDRRVLKKIAELRANHPFLPIQIDIGVNERTAHELVQAGATGLVSASAIFKDGNVQENINKLKNASTN